MIEERCTTTKFAKQIINLTSREIKVYEESSGNICTLPKGGCEMLHNSFLQNDRRGVATFYVVERWRLNTVLKTGCRLDDLAIVQAQRVGRNGEIVSYLVWAKNENISIRLRR